MPTYMSIIYCYKALYWLVSFIEQRVPFSHTYNNSTYFGIIHSNFKILNTMGNADGLGLFFLYITGKEKLVS